MGTKLGGKPGSKPGGKKPFKPYNNAERKSRPGKGGDGGKKQHKLAFSKDGKGPQKRKLPPFKVKREEEEGEKTFYFYFTLLLNFLSSYCFHSQLLLVCLFLLDSQLALNKCHTKNKTRLVSHSNDSNDIHEGLGPFKCCQILNVNCMVIFVISDIIYWLKNVIKSE